MSATFLSNVYKRFFLFPPTFFTFLSFFDLNVYHLYAELNLAIPPCYRDSEDTESVVVVTGASLTAGFIRVWITVPPKRCAPTCLCRNVFFLEAGLVDQVYAGVHRSATLIPADIGQTQLVTMPTGHLVRIYHTYEPYRPTVTCGNCGQLVRPLTAGRVWKRESSRPTSRRLRISRNRTNFVDCKEMGTNFGYGQPTLFSATHSVPVCQLH